MRRHCLSETRYVMPFFPPKTPLTEFKIVRATTQLRVETKAVAVAGRLSIGEACNANCPPLFIFNPPPLLPLMPCINSVPNALGHSEGLWWIDCIATHEWKDFFCGVIFSDGFCCCCAFVELLGCVTNCNPRTSLPRKWDSPEHCWQSQVTGINSDDHTCEDHHLCLRS